MVVVVGGVFEVDATALRVGTPFLPEGMTSLPEGVTSLPAGMTSLLEGMTSLPGATNLVGHVGELELREFQHLNGFPT